MLNLRSVALELTPRCNQRCVYCYNPWRTAAHTVGELTAEEVCRLIDRILEEAELRHVTLTGGEPFLRGDLLEIIDHINGRGLAVAIISNAGLIDRPKAEALAARQVHYVQVTLAGPDAATHDALCGRGSFGATVAGVGCLVGAGVPVGGSFLCTRHNYAAARRTLERMSALGIRHHFAFNRFNPSGCAAEHLIQFLPHRSDVLVALEEANRFAEIHDARIHCTMPIPHCMVEEDRYPRVRFGQCAAGCDQAEYAVDPQGRVKLCTLQKQTIGSLFEHPLSELIANGPAERFRRSVPAFCEPCPHHEGCLGGCGAAAEWVFGRPDEVDPFLAQHVMDDFADRAASTPQPPAPPGDNTVCHRGPSRAVRTNRPTKRRSREHTTVDAWFDLVYHVLALMPVAAGDASSLYDPAYVDWYGEQRAACPQAENAVPRTLAEDARLLASLYDASEQGFLLHGWPELHNGVEAFLATVPTDFAELTWPDDRRRKLAAAILGHTQPGLPDLFRTALWSEWKSGYQAVWHERVRPKAKAYRPVFARQVEELADHLPGLRDMAWVLSHPLRTCGRLLRRGGKRPVIVVGVEDPDLGVDRDLPLMQGCHEYMVGTVQTPSSSRGPWGTVPGRAGYGAFREVEDAALELGDRVFAGTRWESSRRAWRDRLPT